MRAIQKRVMNSPFRHQNQLRSQGGISSGASSAGGAEKERPVVEGAGATVAGDCPTLFNLCPPSVHFPMRRTLLDSLHEPHGERKAGTFLTK